MDGPVFIYDEFIVNCLILCVNLNKIIIVNFEEKTQRYTFLLYPLSVTLIRYVVLTGKKLDASLAGYDYEL